MSLPDVVGLVGVLAYLHAYALAQLQILAITDWRTALLNIVGGVLVMYSLLWSFNLASFVAQAFWMLFTIVGLVKAQRMRSRPATAST
ncbi:cyclic nucleotide-binding protein [Mycobacterium sp. KBS0706]|uniref:CBU_0592 family membrane protein n=1 Tax=Mycobacterium sp. KBS0706 TaxID=2578109 RepID=UPI00110FE846|nr:cyclic nucleotide-binding protein [Mycobacterium sp. KBS0706]TSD87671.1 cyclic nucleotide-binding protein [Mycobacterium sp. KBS0706]